MALPKKQHIVVVFRRLQGARDAGAVLRILKTVFKINISVIGTHDKLGKPQKKDLFLVARPLRGGGARRGCH